MFKSLLSLSLFIQCASLGFAQTQSIPAKKWAFKTGGSVWSSPAIGSDGTIYVGSGDNNLYAINPDGSKKWAFKTSGDVDSSPEIGSDGTIYVGSNEENLYAIKENYLDIKTTTDTRDDAEILLEQHTAKHGGFGIRTWSADKGNLRSFVMRQRGNMKFYHRQNLQNDLVSATR